MNLFKFECPLCKQPMEAETKPDCVIECPSCNFNFAPTTLPNLSFHSDSLHLKPHPALEQATKRVDAQASEAESSASGLKALSVGLVLLGIIVALVVGSSVGTEGAIAVFCSFIFLATIFSVLSRLAAIHAAILRLQK